MTPGPPRRARNPKEPLPDPARLETLCRHHGVDLTREQVEKLWAFHGLLRLRNRELNMTRIHNFESMLST